VTILQSDHPIGPAGQLLRESGTKCGRLRGELLAARPLPEGGVQAVEHADQIIVEHARGDLEQEMGTLRRPPHLRLPMAIALSVVGDPSVVGRM
jgi:hypothetical protein